jgi:hypothetical protein
VGINPIRKDEQHQDDCHSSMTTRTHEAILLDERVQALKVPLVEAGFEVTIIPVTHRGTIPLRRPGMTPRPPILITAKVRDWLERNPDPMTQGVSLINVEAILGHPEGCVAVLLRALADPNVPVYDLFWMDFSPDGRRHLFLFARE